MIALLLPLLVLAALGFVLSLIVHVMALDGYVPPGGEAVFAMHFGVFIVWLPTVLLFLRLNHTLKSRHSWKRSLAGSPRWMRYATYGLFAYAIVNFLIVAHLTGDQPKAPGVTPTLLRGFSGHWMFFYGMAFSMLYSVYRKPWLLSVAKCPSGHHVDHADRFCSSCGAALPQRDAGI
ncbi:hypothetical protein NB717_001428 [Xanthomonas sacchari]|uniref:hypothetical protein n=1 Tax=Xanthomonas sacchari TaxID=56458 RepID=UPI00225E4336|nr:hypothetical protein [Xanthomonas sacchari]MCW0460360.1 hypothetical protein [Xanthomonas sacchari]UYK77960.1 hypothetical protein NG825_06540 [Xanthomonas sacchari]